MPEAGSSVGKEAKIKHGKPSHINPRSPDSLSDNQSTTAPSILPAGKIMKDLSIHKDKPDPVSLPDEEYPDWLWSLTDEALAAKEAGKSVKELQAEGEGGSGDGIGGEGSGKGKGSGVDFKAERRKLRAR